MSLALAAGLSLVACDGNDDGIACDRHPPIDVGAVPDAICDDFSATFVLKDRRGDVLTRFPKREPVTLEYRVTNHAAVERTLRQAPVCSQARLSVDAENLCTVFPKDDPCDFPTVRTTYAAGETKTFTQVWAQTDLDGRPVPAGTYTAVARDFTQCNYRLSVEGLAFAVAGD